MPPKSTKAEFVVKAVALHGSQYDYSKVNYVNNATHVDIKCLHCGEISPITPNKHLAGRGCPTKVCKSIKQSVAQTYSPEQWKQLCLEAHEDKYDYSKTVYLDSRLDVEIYCRECETYFTQNADSHRRGHGCSKCGGTRLLTQEEWESRVRQHHSEDSLDLSQAKYVNIRTLVKVKCIPCDYTWDSDPKGLAKGHGCPMCCQSKSEKCCRAIFQELMCLPDCEPDFAPGYPSFLSGDTGRNQLELDGYYPEIGLAWEYQGRQHTEFVEYWHKTEEAFLEQQARDQRKRELCAANDIILIEIPHIYSFRDPEAMRAFIRGKLVEHDFISDL